MVEGGEFAFATEDWMTIPWLKYEKTTNDKLIDIMLRLPHFRARVNLGLAPSEMERLLSDMNEVEGELAAWKENLPAIFLGYEVPSVAGPFETSTRFVDFNNSTLMNLYYSSLLYLHDLQCSNMGRPKSKELELADVEYARRICRTVPYFVHHQSDKFVGGFALIWPLAMAIIGLTDRKERLYALGVLKGMHSRGLIVGGEVAALFQPHI